MRDGDTLLYLYVSSIATLFLPVPLPVPPARGALIVLAFARLWAVGALAGPECTTMWPRVRFGGGFSGG